MIAVDRLNQHVRFTALTLLPDSTCIKTYFRAGKKDSYQVWVCGHLFRIKGMDILCCYKRADKKRRNELLCTFGGKSFAQIPRISCPRDATVGILGIEHDTCILYWMFNNWRLGKKWKKWIKFWETLLSVNACSAGQLASLKLVSDRSLGESEQKETGNRFVSKLSYHNLVFSTNLGALIE